LEVLLILGLVVFLVYKWLDSDAPKKNYNPINYEQRITERKPARVFHNNDFQSIINKAIYAERRLNITYTDLDGRVTNRTITPVQLFLTNGSGELALSAFCHLRKEKRTFMLERIQTLS
jgi:predicted DNA-binding transcriptional regulator YafY